MKFVTSGPNTDTAGQDFCQNDDGRVKILELYHDIRKIILHIL